MDPDFSQTTRIGKHKYSTEETKIEHKEILMKITFYEQQNF